MNSPTTSELSAAAALLATSDDFRVLRRFQPRDSYAQKPWLDGDLSTVATAAPLKTGLYVDVETTGLSTTTDRVIELALVPFEFDGLGNIYDVSEGLAWYNDPGVPIPREITELTGITDVMVKGESIDVARVDALANDAALIVAHNANFDRRMLERVSPSFSRAWWACSFRDVAWDRFGCRSEKLEHILASTCSEFYDAHRALDDCYVGVHVLASAQADGRSAFSHLLDAARKTTFRVYAMNSKFMVKDTLKARGYEFAGEIKQWYRDMTSVADAAAEETWLRTAVKVGTPATVRLTARDRYSVRADT